MAMAFLLKGKWSIVIERKVSIEAAKGTMNNLNNENMYVSLVFKPKDFHLQPE